MRTSLHTHTTRSDGRATVEALIEGARRAQLDELGVSDHYVLKPDGSTVEWSMPPDQLDSYVSGLQRIAVDTKDIRIRLGIEVDFFPESVDLLRSRLVPYPFDYLIGSVHFVGDFPVDENAAAWEALSVEARDQIWQDYWQLIRQMAESRLFDIVGHLDLPKKFGFLPQRDMQPEIDAALRAIAEAGMSIELNTAGWDKPIGEAYPSAALLAQAHTLGIPLLITSDAHDPADLDAHYTRAQTLARSVGYTTEVRYAHRQPLAS